MTDSTFQTITHTKDDSSIISVVNSENTVYIIVKVSISEVFSTLKDTLQSTISGPITMVFDSKLKFFSFSSKVLLYTSIYNYTKDWYHA